VTCAPLRSTVSQVPSPVERLGIEEKVKITAAHTITGSQVRKRGRVIRRPMLVSGHKPASGKGIRCKTGTVPPL
jgi:hypothetical protein